MLNAWQLVGDAAMTEHWRSVVPDLSVALDEDQTGVANDRRRAESVRRRYALELKHIGGRKRGGMSSLTRISDWVAAPALERRAQPQGVPFSLCLGVPSVLAEPDPKRVLDGLDYAILIAVGPVLLPCGPLLLDGVPLVIRCGGLNRPLPGDADVRWPRDLAIPTYR
jgi:hypothetical protein